MVVSSNNSIMLHLRRKIYCVYVRVCRELVQDDIEKTNETRNEDKIGRRCYRFPLISANCRATFICVCHLP